MVSFLCRLSFNPHFKNKAHGLWFVASWYCDSCSVVLCGVQFVLFCVFTLLSHAGTSSLLLLGSAWISNGGVKKSCPNIDWSEDLGLLSAHVKGCHCSCLSGSFPEFQVFRLLHAGSAYSRACRRKYRATKEWKELQMGTAGLLVWVPQSRPIPINPPGLCGSVLVLSKDLGYQKTHSSREKVLLQGN